MPKKIEGLKEKIDNMENKTFNNFERQFATMNDAHPDEIRDFIATIIVVAVHDNDVVDAAFKWLASRNNN